MVPVAGPVSAPLLPAFRTEYFTRSTEDGDILRPTPETCLKIPGVQHRIYNDTLRILP